MKEQVDNQAGFLETITINSLLWLERHLQKEPLTLDQIQERRLYKRWALFGAAALGGVTLLFLNPTENIGRLNPPSPNPAPIAENVNLSWQNQSEIQNSIDEAKKDGFLVLRKQPIPLMIKNLLFYQSSNKVIITINKENLEKWLNENASNLNPQQRFAINFKDQDISSVQVSGIPNLNFSINLAWQQANGKTKEELYNNFSTHLSSETCLVLEYISKYGSHKTEQIYSQVGTPEKDELINRLTFYKQQVGSSQITPFIKVLAVNPEWIWQKQNQ